MTRTRRLLSTLLLAGALGTACTAGPAGVATSGGAETATAAGGPAGGAVAGGASAAAGSTGTAVDVTARQVLTAGVVVAVDDLAAAAQQVRDVAAQAQGAVSEEQVDLAGDPGGSTARLVLRVPPAPLDDTIGRVAAVGTEISRTRSAADVEGTLVDVASRIATQAASVDRVRALLASATSLTDVVALEAALTSRTADLEVLRARQADVQGRVDLATLTVELRRAPVATVAAPSRTGFLGGLVDGWHALAGTVGVGLTVVGAVLPFLLVAALLGVPAVLLRRRRTGRPTPAAE